MTDQRRRIEPRRRRSQNGRDLSPGAPALTRFRLFAAALLALLALSACHTVEGFGRDVKQAGGQLEEAAEEARD